MRRPNHSGLASSDNPPVPRSHRQGYPLVGGIEFACIGAGVGIMDILEAAGGPGTAEKWIRDALARKERIMGFGHRVYKTGDPRARILKEY